MSEKPAGDAAALLQDLLAAVAAEPAAFDFFALMRRIDALRPLQPRTGEALRPREEALRLGQAPELDFAPAALEGLRTQQGAPPRLSVRFFGLLGPQGAMPLHFTEFVRERLRHHDDPTLLHFLDLFHHRMLSLFYRAWAQSQPVVFLDRPEHDRFAAWLGALAGSTPAGPLPPQVLSFHAGWLTDRNSHPEMLCKVLSQHFGVPARVQEHVGHWMDIPLPDRSRLGYARSRAERGEVPGARLGLAANAGRVVWDRQYRFRIHLGPLDLKRYNSLLPGGTDWQALRHLVELIAGRDKTWDLCLALRAEERPEPRLGREHRLGVSCWIGRAPTPADAPRGRAERQLHLRPLTSFLTRRTPTGNGARDD